MGDGIGSSSVTDCLLRSFSDLKGHTQQCRAALRQKSEQTETEPISSPINYPAYSGAVQWCQKWPKSSDIIYGHSPRLLQITFKLSCVNSKLI